MRRLDRHLGCALTLFLLLASSCGERTPEQRLEEAAERLSEKKEVETEKREQVEEQRAALERAREGAGEAERELAKAEQARREARERLDMLASDVAIFRKLQSAMLQDPELEKDAVMVQVNDGVVTLDGRVSSKEAHQRAIEIARSAPEVKDVRDRVVVAGDGGAEEEERPG